MRIAVCLGILSSLILASCAHTHDKIEIKTVPIERPKLNLHDPEPLKLKPIKWFVITPENYEEVFKALQDSGYELVLFGLTDDGYKNLSNNLANIRRYIIEQKEIIESYKKYYEYQGSDKKEEK